MWLLLYVESNCEVANKIDSYRYLILQSLGAPEWKGPPSSMLIFYDTELRLVGTRHSHGTDVSPSCLGLRRGTRAEHWVKQLICQNNLKKNESNDIELSQCRNIKLMAPRWCVSFFDVMDPIRHMAWPRSTAAGYLLALWWTQFRALEREAVNAHNDQSACLWAWLHGLLIMNFDKLRYNEERP